MFGHTKPRKLEMSKTQITDALTVKRTEQLQASCIRWGMRYVTVEAGFMDAYVKLAIGKLLKSEISDSVLTLSSQMQGSCHRRDVCSESDQGR